MSDLINENNGIVSFTLFKIEKGREKICRCSPPYYILDTANRIVTCDRCGATLDAFEALLTMCDYMGKYEEYQKQAVENIKTYGKLADEEWRRRMRNKAFKDMDKQYQHGLYPICPKCKEQFDPMEITHWQNKRFYNENSITESEATHDHN